MEDFATYILGEENLAEKMMIAYYLSRKAGIYFDKSIVLKAEIAKMFIEYMELDVDENETLTAMLLCNCKKIENVQKIGRLETYAKEGAEYLSTLGFSNHFCKICEEVNRYSQSIPREKESDILEIVDQFTGLILNRVEREAYTTDEAIVILKERNLKHTDNRYLELFETFITELDGITIKEVIDVPVLKKLIHLHNKEANVKAFIVALSNTYGEKIATAISQSTKKKAKEMLSSKNKVKSLNENTRMERMKELVANEAKTANRALFSRDTAQKILNHELKYKMEE